jgi:ABC-2 type transport system permease protein
MLNVFQNPIVAQSLQGRRLKRRIVAAVLLALTVYCLAGLIINAANSSRTDPVETGHTIFQATAFTLLLIITLFAPTMAAGAIAGEREHQTLELLLITLLPARAIVFGKYLSSLIYPFFLFGLAFPLLFVSGLVGSVTAAEFIVTLLLLLVTALAFTALGLFLSSIAQTATNATLLVYGLALPGLFIVPMLAMLAVTIVLNLANASFQLERLVNYYGWGTALSLNPLSAAIYSSIRHDQDGGLFLSIEQISNSSYYFLYPWLIYAVVYSVIMLLVLWLAIWRLDSASPA